MLGRRRCIWLILHVSWVMHVFHLLASCSGSSVAYVDIPDHSRTPWSLVQGLGGAVCFWMDMLDDISKARFPAFEL